MKKHILKPFAMLCIMMLCVSCMGCKKEESVKPGTYIAEGEITQGSSITLSLFKDHTYQFSLGMSNYFKGDYKLTKDDVLELTLTENASKIPDDVVQSITLKKGDKKDQIILETELEGYVASGTVFSK